MTQNIYDHEPFFQGYAQLPRSVSGLAAAPEWPALRALLPSRLGRVVDLGCGYGWFARWAAQQGATTVLALDVSAKMLERAQATVNSPVIRYERADLETLVLAPASADLAYSSLALHYIADLDRLAHTVAKAVVPGGRWVFSVEHPLLTAPSSQQWLAQPAGNSVWPLDRYLEEGPRTRDWLAPGVTKQHRTVATYINTLVRHGFAITHLGEWGPSTTDLARHPGWALDRERPPFLLVGATRAPGSPVISASLAASLYSLP